MSSTQRLGLAQILVCGAALLALSMGIRHGFGLWLQPLSQLHGWGRETFSLAMALQNLVWGFSGIFIGMVADRWGALRVLVAGALLYAGGVAGMALSAQPALFSLHTGVVIGMAQACTTYAVVFGVIGRQVPVERRSWAMGLAGAAGSFGQFLMMPLDALLIATIGPSAALLVLAAMALLIAPLAFGLREPGFAGGQAPVREQTVLQALREALRHRSFLLLTAGYFVCGFQVAFIGVHLPSYLRDGGLSTQVGGYALGIIGLFNIAGTYAAGALGQRLAKRKILAAIYLARSAAITVFLLVPLTPASVYLFAAVMGLLWLSTVPPTNAIVAQVFGVAHLSMLGGFVFFSHQIGSFLGIWLGGVLYEGSGSYLPVWQVAIALGVFAALVNLPVRESPIRRQPLPQGA